MKKETIRKILRGESPSPMTKREVIKKSEKKSLLKGMLQKQEKAIATLQNGTDFEAHYKKGDYQAEKIPAKKQPKQKRTEDDLIAVIESANSLIQRNLSPQLELHTTSKAEHDERIVLFEILQDGKSEGAFSVYLAQKKVTYDGNEFIVAVNQLKKKIEAIFKPYFSSLS